MNATKFTLVCPRPSSPTHGWEIYGKAHAVRILKEPMRSAWPFRDGRVDRVIFDNSIDLSAFFRFVATLSETFEGDVVLIRPTGEALLSSTARGNGRQLYDLPPELLAVYLTDSWLLFWSLMPENDEVSH